jgi:hypothetical protein
VKTNPSKKLTVLISIPNTRLRRRAQFSATCFGVGRSGAVVRLAPVPLPAGVIAARNAACAANTP